jgi:hypothetical protein
MRPVLEASKLLSLTNTTSDLGVPKEKKQSIPATVAAAQEDYHYCAHPVFVSDYLKSENEYLKTGVKMALTQRSPHELPKPLLPSAAWSELI